jgi:SAM-dependent methyltransferase
VADLASTQQHVGAFWDGVSARRAVPRARWWQVPSVIRHVNHRICGSASDGVGDGLIALTRAKLEAAGVPLPLDRAVSVGGGHGYKEMRLIQAGLVRRFDIFELSERRIEQGRADAATLGLGAQVDFHLADAFAAVHPAYDLVHWNNALHHMMDVDRAVAWSRSVLRDGGVFFMDDYVGPDRFQFDAATRRIASEVRAGLPDRLLLNPHTDGLQLPRVVRNIDPVRLAQDDPSEAPQSSRILGAVRVHFPDADIRLTGGVVYNQALKDALANFLPGDPADEALLEGLLILDDVATSTLGAQSHYAVAVAFKGAAPSTMAKAAWQARLTAEAYRPSPEQLKAAFRRLVPSAGLRRAMGQARRKLKGG